MQVSNTREWIFLINFDSELTFEELTITDKMMEEVKDELEEDYNPTEEDVIADILMHKMQEVEQGWGKVLPIPKSELSKLNQFFK